MVTQLVINWVRNGGKSIPLKSSQSSKTSLDIELSILNEPRPEPELDPGPSEFFPGPSRPHASCYPSHLPIQPEYRGGRRIGLGSICIEYAFVGASGCFDSVAIHSRAFGQHLIRSVARGFAWISHHSHEAFPLQEYAFCAVKVIEASK